MSIPGEYNNTLGRQAAYSPSRDNQPITPNKPVALHYEQQDTAFREPKQAPKPMFDRAPGRSKRERARRFCTKPKVIIASIALVIILLLLIVLPLALTLNKGKTGDASPHKSEVVTKSTLSSSTTGIHCEFSCTQNTTCDDYLNFVAEFNCTFVSSDCTAGFLENCTDLSWNGTAKNVTDSPITQVTESSTQNQTETTESVSSTAGENDTTPVTNATTPSTPETTTRIWRPKPPPVANCTGFDFKCFDQTETVGQLKVCDGVTDCTDGSDESDCLECRTSFFCPLEDSGTTGLKKCLRGKVLCDKQRDCPTLIDETFYCRDTCQLGFEYKCEDADICIPIGWMCDGDPQCPNEDDESFCTSRDLCAQGARFCSADKRCIPEWDWCDGVAHCSDGADEKDCNCNFCSGKDMVLCKRPSGRCIKKSQLCNGKMDCDDGEDEENCPGWCKPEQEVDMVRCLDGKDYPKRWACSGVISACSGECEECDPELAFQCATQQLCIPRRQMCDGESQCTDESDEAPELCACRASGDDLPPIRCVESVMSTGRLKCVPAKYRCDGYRDCPKNEDELNCASCYHNPLAFYCETEKSCFPSSSRCDGEVNCPDYSDEDGCTCAECTSQLYQTFLCKANSRCLRKDYVCNEKSIYHCPGSVPEDEQFCQPNFDPLNP